MSASVLARSFVEAFCRSDLTAIEALLAEEFIFRGPLLRCDSRDAYLAHLRDDPPHRGALAAVRRSVEHEDDACLIYDYEKPSAKNTIAQWVRCRNGKIAEMELVFAPGSPEANPG